MKRANPTTIGAFVAGAMTLALIAVMVLGSGRFFRKAHEYALFFPGDVNGLHVGAPVKFRGVAIGSVVAIRLNLGDLPEPVPTNAADQVRIAVIVELDESQIIRHGGRVNLANPETLRESIRKGLRGQLRLESFVTGLVYVSLDLMPKTPVVLYLPQGSRYQEIPTVPTALEQTQATLERLIAKLQRADVPGMMASASSAMKELNQLITSQSLQSAIHSLDGTEQSLSQAARSFRGLADNLNVQVRPLTAGLRGTSLKAEATLADTDRTLASLRTAVEPASPIVYRLNKTLDDVSDAARAVHDLADYLQRNPGAFLRGKYAPADGR